MTHPGERLPQFETFTRAITGPFVGSDLHAKDPRIRRALELLQQRHPKTVNEIAAKLNLSASRFRHLFKKELRVSPRRYLKLARLRQAKVLISSSFLRIKEVAAAVGVNDVSHFVRDYKACYGQTPSQARQFPSKAPRPYADSHSGQ